MLRSTLPALATLVTIAAICAGCDGSAQFRAAVPSKNQVQMRVPGQGSGQALVVGEQADFYKSSLDIATNVNGGVLGAFDIVEHVLQQPPTTQTDNTAVWGPSQPQGLERLSFQLTVVKVADDDFTYQLEARKKGDTGAFTQVFSGEAHPGDNDKGTGTLTYHLGSVRSLDDSSCLLGDIDVAYDAASEPRTLDVRFHAVADTCQNQRPTDAHYTYIENADKSGSMDFSFVANLNKPEENKPAEETMSVRTRWLATGTGRSDVQVSNGDIPGDLAAFIPGTTATTVNISECWDDNFGLSFSSTDPVELAPHLGHEAQGDVSACAFADAETAQL